MSLEILTRLHKQVFMSSQLPNKSFNYQTDWTRELELAGPGPAHLYQKQWNMFYPSRDKLVTSSCASQTRGILTIKCSSFSLLVAYSFLLAFLHFLFARNDLSPDGSTKYPGWRLLAVCLASPARHILLWMGLLTRLWRHSAAGHRAAQPTANKHNQCGLTSEFERFMALIPISAHRNFSIFYLGGNSLDNCALLLYDGRADHQ